MLNAFPANNGVPAEIGTIRFANFNSSGTLDLVAHLVNQTAVSTYVDNLNAPSMAGLPDPYFNVMGANHGYPTNWHMQNTMDVADVNNDGLPDVVTAGYYSRGVAVSLGTSSGVLDSSILYDVGTGSGDLRPQATFIADLDQDGNNDIFVASVNATALTGNASWFKGNGDGTFQNAQQLSGVVGACNDPRAAAAVDIDGDGRPEIAILCYNSPQQGVYVSRRHTDGTWKTSVNLNNSGNGSNGIAMRWGRVSNSSVGPDLVIGGLDITKSVRVFQPATLSVNTSTGIFTYAPVGLNYIQLNGYISDIDIADFNSDSYGDLVIGMQSQNGNTSNYGSVYYTCTGPITPSMTCSPKGWGLEGYQTTSVAAGDIDADGSPDLAVGFKANSSAVTRIIYRSLSRIMNSSY
jgi:hypothetical protein